ncbi:MAG: helix-turn-helix domain containing protein [Lachnospiraceae bacterium]|nr:helix-turn-helix domain containing protein [Lachnospiraceae bacterium]
MSNICMKWHQKSFYDCPSGDEDVNTAEGLLNNPLFITEGIIMDKYSGTQMDFSDMEVPGNDELMILSLLMTLKALSIDQLGFFMRMKGRVIGKAMIARILKKMLAESLVEEYVMSKKYKDSEGNDKKKEVLRLYKTGRNGYYISEQMGIKTDSPKRLYEVRNRYRNQMFHLLTDYTWSQIVLCNLQRNEGMKWFSVDEVRFLKDQRPVFIPLTIQTESETCIFEYVETSYDWEVAEILKKYEEYSRASGRFFTLVLVLQRDHLFSLRSIRQISESGTVNIAFTSVSEWYSGHDGGIFRISKVS